MSNATDQIIPAVHVPAQSPFAFDFSRLMAQHITVAHKSGQNKYGEKIVSTTVDVRCYVEQAIREFRFTDGRVTTSNVTVYCEGVPGINPEDLVTLEDGTILTILGVQTWSDGHGLYYQEVIA